MEIAGDAESVSLAAARSRESKRTLGLVPTMGALHEGHLSLLRMARDECDFVVLYIFVNPLQFGQGEDFERYPRDEDRDAAIAREAGADLLFAPTVEVMYPDGYPPKETIDPGPIGDVLEGAERPGHFRGVLTVVARLFDIAGDCLAYFGEKDAQQLFLVRRVVAARFPGISIVAVPTEREADGLAVSSRNAYLGPGERRAATCLFAALSAASDAFANGDRNAERLRSGMAGVIESEPLASLGYAEIVGEDTFVPLSRVDQPARALVSARIGSTRLIDNVPLGGGE